MRFLYYNQTNKHGTQKKNIEKKLFLEIVGLELSTNKSKLNTQNKNMKFGKYSKKKYMEKKMHCTGLFFVDSSFRYRQLGEREMNGSFTKFTVHRVKQNQRQKTHTHTHL